MVMPKCPVNFYVPNYSKSRNIEFTFNMYQTENRTEYFIAEHQVNVEPYVSEFKQTRTVRFEHTTKFSDDYELEYEVYVEKSRIALEKVVREYKNERSLKSPLRERPPGTVSPNNRRALTKEEPKKEESNPSEKEREEATELSSSANRKIEEKGSSVKQSRNQEVKPTSRTENEAESEEKGDSVRNEPFAKKPSR